MLNVFLLPIRKEVAKMATAFVNNSDYTPIANEAVAVIRGRLWSPWLSSCVVWLRLSPWCDIVTLPTGLKFFLF